MHDINEILLKTRTLEVKQTSGNAKLTLVLSGIAALAGAIVKLQVQIANGSPVSDPQLQELGDTLDRIGVAVDAETKKEDDALAAVAAAIPPAPAPAPAPTEPPAAPPVDSSTADTTDANPTSDKGEAQTITGADVGNLADVLNTAP